jgi:hypothetical protein
VRPGGSFRAAEKAKAETLHVSEYHILPDATWSGTDWLSIAVLAAIAVLMVKLPLASAGKPDEPAPPTAIM